MIYSTEVKNMCVVAKGPNHGPAPIPEEGKWVYAKEIKDISPASCLSTLRTALSRRLSLRLSVARV